MLCGFFGKLDFGNGQFCLPEVVPWWQNSTSTCAVLWACAVCGSVKHGILRAFLLGDVTEKCLRSRAARECCWCLQGGEEKRDVSVKQI